MKVSGRWRWLGSLALGLAMVGLSACGRATGEEYPLRKGRAYDGAPPVIPHQVAELGRQNCLLCHGAGDARSEGQKAPQSPHPELLRCQQCHVERKTEELFRPNRFEGRAYLVGLRQQPFGPPLIPHPLTMRENCLPCHSGETAPPQLRTSHPERERCQQCHVPAHQSWPGARPALAGPAS